MRIILVIYKVNNHRNRNADFDGDVLNQLGLPLEEISEFFRGFSPMAMLINRTNSRIRYDISALENITIGILSDI